MGRPWEYPRWKRVLMQVTMWVILGASLGLAQLISHQRANSPQADLGPPQLWGRLIVRLPEGWDMQERELDQVLVIEGVEEDRARKFLIEQRLSPQSGDDDTDDSTVSPSSEKIEFPGLGCTGTLSATKELHQMRQGSMIQTESLRAHAQLPDGLSVTVRVAQSGVRIGSADRQLIRQIVRNIKLAR